MRQNIDSFKIRQKPGKGVSTNSFVKHVLEAFCNKDWDHQYCAFAYPSPMHTPFRQKQQQNCVLWFILLSFAFQIYSFINGIN